jgi:hypothetical protein
MAQLFLVVVTLISALQTVAPATAAGERPDFTGTWTLEHVTGDPRSRSTGAPSFFVGSAATIQQAGDRLTLTQSAPRAHPALTFRLDGLDSQNTLPNFHDATSWQFSSRARWEYNTLVIETTGAWETKMRWSITPSGKLSIQDWAPSIDLGTSVNAAVYSRR